MEDFDVCPFNAAHRVKRKRFLKHMLQCQKNVDMSLYTTCIFNATHVIKKEDKKWHLHVCKDAIQLGVDKLLMKMANMRAYTREMQNNNFEMNNEHENVNNIISWLLEVDNARAYGETKGTIPVSKRIGDKDIGLERNFKVNERRLPPPAISECSLTFDDSASNIGLPPAIPNRKKEIYDDTESYVSTYSLQEAKKRWMASPSPNPSNDNQSCISTYSLQEAKKKWMSSTSPNPSTPSTVNESCVSTYSLEEAKKRWMSSNPSPPTYPSHDNESCISTYSLQEAKKRWMASPSPNPSNDNQSCISTYSLQEAKKRWMSSNPSPPTYPSQDNESCISTYSLQEAKRRWMSNKSPIVSQKINGCDNDATSWVSTCSVDEAKKRWRSSASTTSKSTSFVTALTNQIED